MVMFKCGRMNGGGGPSYTALENLIISTHGGDSEHVKRKQLRQLGLELAIEQSADESK